MKNYCDRLGFLTTLTVILMAAPSIAAENQITDIELDQSNHQLELKLARTSKTDTEASFFTVRHGNTIEANLLNTNLDLAQGNSYQQDNPLPGIKAVAIKQVDPEHTQILIDTEPDIAIEHLLQQQGDNLILSLNRVTKAQSLQRGIKEFSQQAVTNIKQTYKSALGEKKTKDDAKGIETFNKNEQQNSDVLIPNPEVVITNKRPNNTKEQIFTAQDAPNSPPATIPRAVAPPVGDMAISNISTMPDMVDLGAQASIPTTLVMKDASVREVLSLLARTANLSVVYSDGEVAQGQEESQETTISIDLENQPLQEAFNSVLLVSGLDANRQGNIIYVGKQLPPQARNLISRTIRLNQVGAENAALYLASQGAQGKRLTTVVQEITDPETGRVVQKNEGSPQLQDLDAISQEDAQTQTLVLKGLQVSTDSRLNAIMLVGEPRKVEVATAMLTQLDARRRQVSVNVKVIDVNLLNQDVFNSSFSFGINDSFFVNDNGSASLRFGDSTPPNTAELNSPTGRASNPPIVNNPFASGNTFIDFNDSFTIPGAAGGIFDAQLGRYVVLPGDASFFRRFAGVSSNPFATGATEFTPGTDGSRTSTPGTNGTPPTYTFTNPTPATATTALPSFFQYPDRFLSLLEAKITSGNAKILTDPTLMVQEGQQATVKLVQNIVESVKTEIEGDSGTRTITPVIAEAGVVLTVNVERIDDNGFVSMSVSPSVSSIGATQSFDSGGGAENFLNLLSKRELSSGLVRLRDGQTLILSGIIQDSERTTVSKVPILGDLPILGALFRSTDKTNERAEVIVLLTPEIVEEDAGLASNFSPSKESREVLNREGVEVLPASGN
ncbi:general secretion pathway protein D [Chondrocystis sp. NIES-4102]|nr:general secretion pathway protein D [Chondrocystis sp. NIES-4102]